MKDVRSFLRYLLPGLVFIINSSVPLLILHWDVVLPHLSKIKDVSGLITLVGLLALSGGLGYIFSVIYFSLRHMSGLHEKLEWNHEPAILSMKQMGFCFEDKREAISLKSKQNGANKKKSEEPVLNRDNCLVISNHYWYILAGKSKFKRIDLYVEKLCDQLHGLGATIIASFCSLICFLFVKKLGNVCIVSDWLDGIALLYIIGFPTLAIINYRGLKGHIESQINSSLVSCAEWGIFDENEKTMICL